MTHPTAPTILCVVLTLCGCSVQLDVVPEKKEIRCTDTRNGHTFSFLSETVTNAVLLPSGDACFTATTDSGTVKTLCKSHEAFLMCEATKL